MRTLSLSILLLVILIQANCRWKLEQLSTITPQQLQAQGLVELSQSSENRGQSKQLLSHYYVIRNSHKEKKQAYQRTQSIFKRVVQILLRHKIIPEQNALVKSRIKPQYLSKKRSWSFSTIFVIFGSEKELERAGVQLSNLKVQRLHTHPSINFLNEKVIALEVFNQAKDRLNRQLERFPDFQIKEVAQIQIKGAEVENSDIIEEQLEDEFNQSEQIINQEEIVSGIANQPEKSSVLQMNIIFRVGLIEDEDSEYDGYDEMQEQSEDDSQESNESL